MRSRHGNELCCLGPAVRAWKVNDTQLSVTGVPAAKNPLNRLLRARWDLALQLSEVAGHLRRGRCPGLQDTKLPCRCCAKFGADAPQDPVLKIHQRARQGRQTSACAVQCKRSLAFPLCTGQSQAVDAEVLVGPSVQCTYSPLRAGGLGHRDGCSRIPAQRPPTARNASVLHRT